MRVTGKIIDSTGFPLEGVNISVQETTKGTITNSFGNFVIDVVPYSTLNFSYVGLTPVSKVVSSEIPLTIVLQEDPAYSFPEVIVSAPGKKESSLTWLWLLLAAAGIYTITKGKKVKEVEV